MMRLSIDYHQIIDQIQNNLDFAEKWYERLPEGDVAAENLSGAIYDLSYRVQTTATTIEQRGFGGAESNDSDADWMPYDDGRIESNMGGLEPTNYKGQLTKLAEKYPDIRRDATVADRERLEKPSIRFVYSRRRVYDMTEGRAQY